MIKALDGGAGECVCERAYVMNRVLFTVLCPIFNLHMIDVLFSSQ